MTSQMTVGLFALAGVLFLVAGLLPVFRGESLNVVFFVLGIAFLILSVTFRTTISRSRDRGESQ
jgi:hypothetical protein